MSVLKKKPVKFLFFIFVFFLFLHFILPLIILTTLETPPESSDHFINSYEESKSRFLQYEESLTQTWNDVSHEAYTIEQEATIDLWWANANQSKTNLIVLTSGVHGVEGYVGSAMMDVFLQDISRQLHAENTGIVLVHSINPIGMKEMRRYNENNVDLNRNFIYDWDSFDKDMNSEYEDLKGFLQPEKPVGNIAWRDAGFYGEILKTVITDGSAKIEKALLTGQYTQPEGVYYGGNSDEPSTQYVKKLFQNILQSEYKNIMLVDLHTGYGPRYQMSIFSSGKETMTQEEAQEAFHYPLVFTPDSEEFYTTNGDVPEYFVQLKEDIAPSKNLFATTFEFGTMGDGLLASVDSVKRTIMENQLAQHGSKNKTSTRILNSRYREMFYPSELKWRNKAVDDFLQAFEGILKYNKMIDEKNAQ
ncbi:murein peptide amidase A [Bacillus sp. THAF10]|uniref:M14 family metallopeptidase n=1 Tax=Bacillus sp. THAF10 TaxID=2587848 RepID=UPI0012A9724A|nr:M14 family metallopeptidase [Bacillus sp. THAF10]QFT88994.1 murein peptide amidase A [Bacillus sp. THAF10]